MQSQGTKLNIQNPDTIARILEKICSLRLTVFVRSPSFGTIVIKGVATRIETVSSDDGTVNRCVNVSNLSKQALSYLIPQQPVSFEFVLLSSMLVAKSEVLLVRDQEVLLLIPKELSNIERRSGMRHRLGRNNMAYLSTQLWQISDGEANSPLSFSHFDFLAKRLELVDISREGFCALSRQPGLSEQIKVEAIDDAGLLHLPMRADINVSFKVMWVKKVTGDLKEKSINRQNPVHTLFLFGCQFLSVDDHEKNTIDEFIRTLMEAKAI